MQFLLAGGRGQGNVFHPFLIRGGWKKKRETGKKRRGGHLPADKNRAGFLVIRRVRKASFLPFRGRGNLRKYPMLSCQGITLLPLGKGGTVRRKKERRRFNLLSPVKVKRRGRKEKR